MADIASLPALFRDPVALLALPMDEPERLFSSDVTAAKAEYRALAGYWHPDRNDDVRATDVFQHVMSLHRAAEERRAAGIWRKPGLLVLKAVDGQTFEMRWRKRRRLEVGEVLIAPLSVVYLVDKAHRDLFEAAIARMKNLRYANDAMKAEFSRYMPTVRLTFETADQLVMVLDKTHDVVLLADLVEHLGGRLEARHGAWILSSLLNIACYLAWTGMTHNAISMETVFVSPRYHSALLLGGWWYADRIGDPLRAAPGRSVAAAPADLLTAKKADPRLDLQCIRLLGREVLGDPAGNRLVSAGVPQAVADWLRYATSGSPQEDYKTWAKARDAGFGPPRFIPLDVDPEHVYPPVRAA